MTIPATSDSPAFLIEGGHMAVIGGNGGIFISGGPGRVTLYGCRVFDVTPGKMLFLSPADLSPPVTEADCQVELLVRQVRTTATRRSSC